MQMDNYSMYLPSYTIGDKAYDKVYEVCKQYGKTAVVLGGNKAMAAAKPYLDTALAGTDFKIIEYLQFGNECSYGNVNMVAANKSVIKADMIFAVGGGKATDTAKCVGELVGKPVFTFPTIASNCACCTSVSIMYSEEGVFVEPHFFERPPVHAFINTEIIANSPIEYMWAGIGDTYAKYYEATISARGETPEHFTWLGVTVSAMCKDPLLKYGRQALEDNKNHVNSYALSQVVLAITISTGLASIFVTRDHTPDYNSGVAHAMFYALTPIKNIEENHLHGEVVAFGVLILLLCDKNYDEFEKLYAFNKSVSLPTSIKDLELTREQLNKILPSVPNMSDIKHYPYTVTEDMLNEAFSYLDEYNKKER